MDEEISTQKLPTEFINRVRSVNGMSTYQKESSTKGISRLKCSHFMNALLLRYWYGFISLNFLFFILVSCLKKANSKEFDRFFNELNDIFDSHWNQRIQQQKQQLPILSRPDLKIVYNNDKSEIKMNDDIDVRKSKLIWHFFFF